MRLAALVIWIGLILVSPVVFYMGFEIFSPAEDGVSPASGNPAQSGEDVLASSAYPEYLSIRAIKGRGEGDTRPIGQIISRSFRPGAAP